jgi:hypothetical protein
LAARQDFDDARLYASESGREAQRVWAINDWNASREIHVLGLKSSPGSKLRNGTTRFTHPHNGREMAQIKWFRDQCAMGTNGTKVPSAGLLLHEAAHSANSADRDKFAAIPMGLFTNAEEHRVITGVESDSQRSHGLRPRDTHGPSVYYQSTGGVRSTQAADPGAEQLLQAHGRNLESLSAKLDEFGVDRSKPPQATLPKDPTRIQTGSEALGQTKFEMYSLTKNLHEQKKPAQSG